MSEERSERRRKSKRQKRKERQATARDAGNGKDRFASNVPITPFEVWAKRYPYLPPPAPKKGPVSSYTDRGTEVKLYGPQPYFGPSKRTVKRRATKGKLPRRYAI